MTQGKSFPFEEIIKKRKEIDELAIESVVEEEKYKQLEFEFDEDLVAPI